MDGQQTQLIEQSDIASIIAPRAAELLSLIHEEILKSKLLNMIPAGLVLTGGGSLLPGMKELAQEIFNVPVRIGTLKVMHDVPQNLESPIYATGYGLLKQVIQQQNHALDTINGPAITRIFMRMKSWVIDFF